MNETPTALTSSRSAQSSDWKRLMEGAQGNQRIRGFQGLFLGFFGLFGIVGIFFTPSPLPLLLPQQVQPLLHPHALSQAYHLFSPQL